jgi:hypothetical protein
MPKIKTRGSMFLQDTTKGSETVITHNMGLQAACSKHSNVPSCYFMTRWTTTSFSRTVHHAVSYYKSNNQWITNIQVLITVAYKLT